MKNYFTLFSLLFAAFFVKAEIKYLSDVHKDNYVINKEHMSYKLFQWQYQQADLYMMPCPESQVINLGPGECGRVIPSFGFAFPALVPTPQPITINQNANTVTVNSTSYCAFGQTKYSKTMSYSGNTDLLVTSINLGVYESFNNPLVRFDFKTTSGDLLGTYLTTIPNLNFTVHNVVVPVSANIKIPAGSSFVMEVTTNAPFISRFKIGMNNAGYVAGSTPTQITSLCNTLNVDINPNAGAITPNAVLFNVSGRPDDYRFVNILNNYEEGDYFGVGTHPLTYRVTDALGNSTACAFSITVNEFQSTNGALVCNDLVQVSFENDCELVITPDMLLEGNHYGCFDNFTVQIIDNNGQNLGNKVGKNQIGKTLKTQVFNGQGNSCWGEIYVLDKLGPIFECGAVYANCGSDLSPGAILNERVAVAAIITDGALLSGSPNSKTFNIPVGTFSNTTITDLNVYLEVEHSNVSQLAANITGPGGITVPLFVSGGCAGTNLQVTFDDGASPIICEPSINPSVAGTYAPYNSLAVFNGLPLGGNWQVTIYDLSGVGGKVNKVHLIFGQDGATVPFPTSNPDITALLINDNTYRVTGIDPCTDATIVYQDEVVEEDCYSIYSKVIKRCWTGIDLNGNSALPCCQFIYIYRNSLSTLTFPPNYDGLPGNQPSLSCKDWGYTIPTTSVTGLPNGDSCENIQLTETEDAIIDICAGSYKIFRTHKVIEWCSGSVLIHNQIIKVVDDEGPVLECPSNLTISTENNDCTGSLFVERPKIESECSPAELLSYHLSYSYDGEEYFDDSVNQNTRRVTGLRIGDNLIKWTVTDDCGNSSECTFTVTVRDDIRPTPVCDQFTRVAIGGNGVARVNAITFDDGSHDNCGILTYEVRKTTGRCNTSTIFRDFVDFCCNEVDPNFSAMVELRVTDIYGNSNTCMVEVRVEDKLPPFITQCPSDITLDCQADFEDLTVTGEPVAVDNCGIVNVTMQDSVNINQCGEGTVIRTWTVFDAQGFRHSCVQLITLRNSRPFYYNINNPNDPRNDIQWPRNHESDECFATFHPDDLPVGRQRPIVNDDNCSLVAMTYKDQTFKFVEGACEKVIRTWTVIDWCTYNDANPVYGQGWYEHTQIIKLINDVKPDFEFNCVNRVVSGFGDNCTGEVRFTMEAVDDCPKDNTNLNWKYELFREDGVTLIVTRNTNMFNHTLTAGIYKVRWTAEDKCGNQAVCNHDITVLERKKPTPYCITSLTTAVMNSDGTVAIWAKDYDRGATDNCTPQSQLKFTFFGEHPVDSLLNQEHYFRGNGTLSTRAEYLNGDAQIWIPNMNSSGLVFSCDDIPNGISQEVTVDVTVTDLAGNSDFCTVRLVLQDNSNICPDNANNNIYVSGRVVAGNTGIEMIIEGESTEQTLYTNTNSMGNFNFSNLSHGTNYKLKALDNRNILNGVTTLDLVLIQRHILGINEFTDMKSVIASDIDNNQRITASDLVALRKSILGLTNEFPNGQNSWRFVATDFIPSDVSNPFPFKENYQFNDINKPFIQQNFQAVKIGDVNGTVTLNTKDEEIDSRTQKAFFLAVDAVSSQNGEVIEVPIYSLNNQVTYGFQWTFNFDIDGLEFLGYDGGTISMDDSNFAFNRLGDGFIPTVWHSENPKSLNENDILFTLKFRAIKDINISKIVDISSEITESLAINSDEKQVNIQMDLRGQVSSGEGFKLYQNQPNPFNTSTNIDFNLPESGIVKLSILDISGRVVYAMESYFDEGLNSFKIDGQSLPQSGVLIYRVDTGKYSDLKKMILLK